jgi:tetratricopeptide (TPR) repeat protein
MTGPNQSTLRPSLTDLFTQYLQDQADAHARGLGYAAPTDQAVPHEAVPVQPVDPQLAYKDAVVVAGLLHPGRGSALAVPPDWPTLVGQQEPAVALAFCLGNFPQLVRNLHILLTREPAALRDVPSQAVPTPLLLEWADQVHGDPQRLLAAGVLRLARHFDRAAELLAEAAPGWEALHANEAASLAWHRGQAERALALWQRQPDSAPVLFNRGMAKLFLGQSADAVADLSRAVSLLPETSAWHHLGQLYLALAQAR